MGLNHNKKRNVGLLREFFSKHIAVNIVKKDNSNISKAKDIWFKYNNKNSELYKELKVVTSILETKFDNKQIAYDYMMKLKSYCKTIAEDKLEFEKTNFLREINNKISDKDFFNRDIDNYVDIASAQLLVSSWIKNNENIDFYNQKLEDKVLNFICTKSINENKKENKLNDLLESVKNKDVDSLVIKIMHEKFNKKFSNQLTEDQKYILRNFIFEENDKVIKEKIESIRDTALELIDTEIKNNQIIKSEKDKLLEIKNLILNNYYDIEELNDSNIIFYMSVSKLNEELKEEEKTEAGK